MKKLLNTLYVISPDAYLSLSDGNIMITLPDDRKSFVPLHTLNSVVCFSHKGASPALMGYCAKNSIRMSFYSPTGAFLFAVDSEYSGNVLLRMGQFQISKDEEKSLPLARNMIIGKLYNEKFVLLRCVRDHALRVNGEALRKSVDSIQHAMESVRRVSSEETLRGLEGNAASAYFSVFDHMILQNKDRFYFHERNRRPPLDRVNALLSFSYSLLANDCAGALKSVGLDPYVGFMHALRPGRTSLALDLMEELRPAFADRFVLTLINNRMISADDFEVRENESVLLTDSGRKTFLNEWQKKKREEITHPFLNEKVSWGLVPFLQAQLLARTIRGDLDEYPSFFWK